MPGTPSKSAETTAPPGRLFHVPLVLLVPLAPPVLTPLLAQPGIRNARLMTLRPASGRFTTCFVSIVFASTLDSGSTSGVAASVTVTISCTAATSSVTFSVVTRAVWTTTD